MDWLVPLDSVRDDPNLLKRVITGDESWVYGNDVETKAQSSQWKLPHEPRPKLKEQLKKITKNDFLKCLKDWKNVGTSVSGGDYFEGE